VSVDLAAALGLLQSPGDGLLGQRGKRGGLRVDLAPAQGLQGQIQGVLIGGEGVGAGRLDPQVFQVGSHSLGDG
jgi:hypothetical protein